MKQKQIAQQILDLDKHLNQHPYDVNTRIKRNELIDELCVLILEKKR